MSDAETIHNLLSDEQFNEALSSYTDSQLEFIPDMNNGNYSSGQINYDLLSVRDKWFVPSECWLSIPVSFTSSTAVAYTQATILAFKQSVLNFITGCNLTTSNGATIFNDQQVDLVNNLRLVLEKDQTWYQNDAPKLLFAKDTIALNHLAVGVQTPTNDATNAGLTLRTAEFKQICASPFAGATFNATLQIPLSYIHSFYENCKFPLINARWLMSFNINTFATPQRNPMVAYTVANPNETGQPTITVTGSTRLYYKSLKFSPELNQKLVQKINHGLVKTVHFKVTDTYQGEANFGASTTNRLISPSTVAPLRVTVLSPVTGGVSGLTTVLSSVAQFTNANILVNNSLYYQNSLNTAQEQYRIVAEQCPSYNSNGDTENGLISFSEFLNGYRYLTFDLSRLKDRLKNPNQSVSLQIQATKLNATTCDLWYVVERLNKVVINMSSAETKYVVGL